MLGSRSLRLLFRCTGLLAGLVLTACNSGAGPAGTPRATPGPASPADDPVMAGPVVADPGFALPPPSQLGRAPQPRRASYTEEEIIMPGAGFFGLLPNQNVAKQGTTGVYNASWSGGLSGAAYGIYRLDTAGFDREPIVQYRWDPAPDPLGAAWIGLANWPSDRWEWRQCTGAGQFNFGDIGPYGDPASQYMYVAVVVAGTGASALRFIRIGDSLVTAAVSAAPVTGVAPCTVSFDGSGSFSPLGLSDLDLFHWDFDGDGTVDASGPDAEVTHEYSAGGTHDAVLTVETDNGELAEASVPVTLTSPWAHSWGGVENEWVNDLATDGDAIYVAGATQSFANGDGHSVLLLKYGLDGTLLWARTWSGPVHDTAFAVAVAGDSIFTAGHTESYGAGAADLLLQRWDADGNLVWTRTWGRTEYDIATGVGVRDGVVYVCGNTSSFADPQGDGLVMAWDFDGNVIWARIFGTPDKQEAARDLQPAGTFISDLTRLHIAGVTHAYGGSHGKLLYGVFDGDGVMLELKSMDFGDDATGNAIHVTGGLSPEIFIAGQLFTGLNTSALLVEVAADPLVLKWGGAGNMAAAYDLARRGDSLYVAGYRADALGGGNGFLYRISNLGALENTVEWSDTATYEALAAVLPFPGCGMVCAGQANSAAGGWSIAAAPLDALDLAWVEQPPGHYDAALFEPVTGSPSQPPETSIPATLDEHAGGDLYEAFVTVVAQ